MKKFGFSFKIIVYSAGFMLLFFLWYSKNHISEKSTFPRKVLSNLSDSYCRITNNDFISKNRIVLLISFFF